MEGEATARHEPEVVAIVGPTAVGKSALALTLADELTAEIVNADALQVYRRLDIGTAKPTAEERRRVRHHLIDILEPEEPFSAGEFARRARRAIEEIHGRGKIALVVGGSGFYLRALLDGLSPLPAADPEVRRGLQAQLESEGLAVLYGELEAVDPETASRLQPGDTQRVTRALEVHRSTGQPLSWWLRKQPSEDQRLPALRIGLTLPRSILYDRIAGRVHQMVERGWVDEVRQLLREGLDPMCPAFQAIGYRQMVDHLRGGTSLASAVEDTVRETRRFAKRQLTWFRKEEDIAWLEAAEMQWLASQALEKCGFSNNSIECSGLGRAHG